MRRAIALEICQVEAKKPRDKVHANGFGDREELEGVGSPDSSSPLGIGMGVRVYFALVGSETGRRRIHHAQWNLGRALRIGLRGLRRVIIQNVSMELAENRVRLDYPPKLIITGQFKPVLLNALQLAKEIASASVLGATEERAGGVM